MEKFSELRQGDCLKVLKTLPENSIDACITDPPYGLEFMGKEWDKLTRLPKNLFGKMGEEGANDLKVKKNFKILPRYYTAGGMIEQWHYNWAKELIRIMKPGAHILVAGIGRTHHRTMCAIEDAGFEIRDCIYHLFGCLSEDTEILTNNGWKNYQNLLDKDKVICYNINSNELSEGQIQRRFLYDYENTAYRIK